MEKYSSFPQEVASVRRLKKTSAKASDKEIGMEALGLGMQTGEARESQGPKSLTAAPPETAVSWLCGEGSHSPGDLSGKASVTGLPKVRPGKSHVDL